MAGQTAETPTAGPRLPLRAGLAWPAATALIGAIQVGQNVERYGGDLVSVALALAAAACLGGWLGLLGLAIATLGTRWEDRLEPVRGRVRGWLRAAPGPLIVATLFAAAAWESTQFITDAFAATPPDFDEVAIQVWRGAILLAVPMGGVVAYGAARALGRLLSGRAWARPLTEALLLSWSVAIVSHFSSGDFARYFGAALPALLLVLCAGAAGLAIPRLMRRSRRSVLGLAAAVAVFAAGGYGGLHHVGARALLLHDAEFTPLLLDVTVAWLDGDGDGALPVSLGGGDCDDSDPEVAPWRPEIPANGKDDNCRLGDAPARDAPRPVQSDPARRVPIFLITIDTVRADHLADFGYARDTMPFLTGYGRDARWFRRAYSPSNNTLMSIFSILSAQSPERLIADVEVLAQQRVKFTQWLPDRLARVHGYRTIAYRPPLVDIGRVGPEVFRFETYRLPAMDFAPKNRNTSAMRAVDWVLEDLAAPDQDDRPIFSWLHIMDPHAVHMSHIRFEGHTAIDGYDNELSWVDQQLMRLLAGIHRKYGDEVLVIITSDHGESFGRHGEYGHGFSLHEEELHVPLMVRGPGITAGVVTDPVSVGGIAPMVLELLGDELGAASSYASVLAPDRPVVASSPFFTDLQRFDVALIDGTSKILHSRATNTTLVFDLEGDPNETANLASRDPELRARLEQALWEALEQGL